ncbi:MAG TPA: NAD(P)/FAD-dependent oxidoreductase [Casimicrobiaceae bacterium]
MNPGRRRALAALSALAGLSSLAVAGCADLRARNALARHTGGLRPRVVVIGGGYGGATAARYLAVWGKGAVDVTLVEREPSFVSTPLSNLVVAGSLGIADITVDYAGLAKLGVRIVRDSAVAVDAAQRRVRLARGSDLRWDRLILSPGIGFLFDRVAGLASTEARATFLHAWQAGPQTQALRRQLESMRDGGVFAISIPVAPLRCPPAPYERACLAAWYLQRTKPRSKVLILDGNSDVQSEKELFEKAWNGPYKGIVEYRHDCVLTGVDLRTRTAHFEIADDVTADVLNVIPPHGAAAIAHEAGVVTANGRWCEVDFATFESIRVPGIHVLGDAIQIAPVMPKSGHMANQHGKAAAAAILSLLAEAAPEPLPLLTNTCYTFFDDREAAHVCSVHRYDAAQRSYIPMPGAGGVASGWSAEEGRYGFAWAHAIWRDMLA